MTQVRTGREVAQARTRWIILAVCLTICLAFSIIDRNWLVLGWSLFGYVVIVSGVLADRRLGQRLHLLEAELAAHRTVEAHRRRNASIHKRTS